MPEGMMPQQGAPSAGGASPPQPQQGQASGPAPATGPVANRGHEAMALAALAVVVQGLQSRVLPMLPASSEAAADIRKALNDLSKHVPQGAVSQGVQMTEAQKNLMQQKQMGPQIAAMRAAQPGGAPPPAAPPQPQMAA